MAAGSKDVRLFLRAGSQRLEDARSLLGDGRAAGAVYLAGYAVECALKAALLATAPRGGEGGLVASFRGAAHDLERLRERYYERGGPRVPVAHAGDFTRLTRWTVALRYDPKDVKLRTATAFLGSADRLFDLFQNRSR